jgi:hypothetical protein
MQETCSREGEKEREGASNDQFKQKREMLTCCKATMTAAKATATRPKIPKASVIFPACRKPSHVSVNDVKVEFS